MNTEHTDSFGDRLEECYSGAVYDVLRAMGLPDQILPRAIRLSPADNILVLAQSVQAGDIIEIEGVSHRLSATLGLGHKVAAKRIEPGEKILKYGAAIGSATAVIEPGEHVHLHNMQSDYLPTFTLEEERAFHTTP